MLNDIFNQFVKNSWTWKIAGELNIPTLDDIKKTLDAMKKRLYDEPNGSQMELGRLIMIKDDTNIHSVYMYVGDYEGENDDNN